MRRNTHQLIRTCALLSFMGCGGGDVGAGLVTSSLTDPVFPGFPTATGTPTSPTGSLPGELSAEDDGTASYRVPLAVPPGRNGMEPDLELRYSSSGGRGLLGVGFSLAGVPGSVVRCPPLEGRSRKIEFDSESFCWGGQRLVRIGPLSYRTREEAYARIRAVGSDVDPTAFVIELRNGRILRFEQRVRGERYEFTAVGPNPLGEETLEWAISSEEDRYGNKIEYSWGGSTGNLDTPDAHHLSKIRYTGWETAGNREVRFLYQPRPDYSFSWHNGIPRAHVISMFRIEMYAPNTPGDATARQWYYDLSYERAALNGAQRLASVTRCSHSDSCHPSTQFQWSDSSFEFADTGIRPAVGAGYLEVSLERVVPADIDGDGRDDLVVSPHPDPDVDAEWHVTFATDTGYTPVMPATDGQLASPNWFQSVYLPVARRPVTVDLDGDGGAELIGLARQWPGIPTHDVAGWAVVDAGPGFTDPTEHVGGMVYNTSSSNSAYASDFNGDGAVDLLIRNSNAEWIYYEGSGAAADAFGPPTPMLFGYFGGANGGEGHIYLTDGDGDGRREIMVPQNSATTGNRYVAVVPTPGGPVQTSTSLEVPAIPGHHRHMDVNGDGLLDAVDLGITTGVLRVRINTGNGFDEWRLAELSHEYDPWFQYDVVGAMHNNRDPRAWYHVMDYDMDGRDDIVVPWMHRAFLFNGHIYRTVELSSSIAFSSYPSGGPSSPPFVGEEDPTPFQLLDWNGDGLADLWHGQTVHTRMGERPNLLVRITSGLGATDTISYRPVRDLMLESNAEACSYPLSCPRGSSQWVVDQITRDDGIPDTSTSSDRTEVLRYGAPFVDRHTGRFLGFERVHRYFVEEERTVATIYGTPEAEWVPTGSGAGGYYDWHKAGRWQRQIVVIEDDDTVEVVDRQREFNVVAGTSGDLSINRANQLVLRSTFRWQIPASQYATCSANADPDHALDVTCWSHRELVEDGTTEYSDFTHLGDPRRVVTSLNGGARLTTTEFFYGDYSGGPLLPGAIGSTARHTAWLLGRPDFVRIGTRTRRTPTSPYEHAVRLSRFGWNDRGALVASVREPGLNPLSTALTAPSADPDHVRLTTTRDYDPLYGLLQQIVETDSGGESRVTAITYDEDDTLIRSVRNPAGHLTWIAALPATGSPVLIVDPNGVQSSAMYDAFGRLEQASLQGGDSVDLSYVEMYKITATRGSGGFATVDFDRLGREIVSTRSGLHTTIGSSTSYDTRGRVLSRTMPSTAGEAAITVTPSFDRLGRLRQLDLSHPIGGAMTALTRTYDYAGLGNLVTETFSPRGGHERLETGPTGTVSRTTSFISATESLSTTFESGPLGITDRVVDTLNNERVFRFDVLGRNDDIDDPDRGHRTARYNAWGELTYEEAPHGAVTYQRDSLGRVLLRSEANGGDVAIYQWDTGAHGVGSLDWVQNSSGTIDFSYDSHGRTARTAQNGMAIEYYYDAFGRLEYVKYPEWAGVQRVVLHEYDPTSGVLRRIYTDDGEFEWVLNSHDGHGRPLSTRHGNADVTRSYHPLHGRHAGMTVDGTDGVVYDSVLTYHTDGLVNSRQELVAGTSEVFEYDALDRLEAWTTITADGSRSRGYSYDDLGNLELVESTDSAGDTTEQYQYEHEQPSAVSAIVRTGGAAGVTTTEEFGYDDSGRQESALNRHIQFNGLDLPASVQGPNGTVNYGYDALGRRASKSSSAWGDSVYSGRDVERAESAGGENLQIISVYGPFGLIGVIRDAESGDVENPVLYTHADGLGSAVVITDPEGGLVERQWFSPFGMRLDEEGRDTSAGIESMDRGFTGHRSEDELGLIDMQGRFYDPRQRRFVSPDPILGSFTNGQRWNPYSYVLNSPMNLVDPTGFGEEDADYGDMESGDCVGAAYCGGWEDEVVHGDAPAGGTGMGGNVESHMGYDDGFDLGDIGWGDSEPDWDSVDQGASEPTQSTTESMSYDRPMSRLEREAVLAEGMAVMLIPLGVSMLPGAGELADVDMLLADETTTGDRLIALGSLGITVLTAGFFFNAAAVRNGLENGVEVVSAASHAARPNFPPRVLPTDRRGVPIPDSPYPHTQLGFSRRKFGHEPQAREWDYGANGELQPTRDIDFTDHGAPTVHPNPHQHTLTPNNPRLAPRGGFRRGPPTRL